MKSILKDLRSFFLFNIPVRFVVRAYLAFSNRVFTFFTVHWPVSGTIIFKLPGEEKVKIYSRGDDFVSTQAYWKGYMGYEGPAIQLFYQLAKKSATVFDIGANVGYFTLIAAAANSNATVYSFEPVERVFLRLQKNIQINQFINAKPFMCAVGNVDGKITFFIPEGTGMAHAGSTKKGWANKTIQVDVDSVTVDEFAKSQTLPKIDLVKMDCEFHETEVLEGMKKILEKDKPIILSEVLFPESEGVKGHFENQLHLKIESMLKENGYFFYLINSTALIRVDRLEYNQDDRNYLFSTRKSEKVYMAYSDMNELLRNIR
jgi:FkbM family methyltransferase